MVDCETNSTTVFAMVFYLYVASFGHPGCPSQKFYTQKYAKVNLLPICWKSVFGFFGPRPPPVWFDFMTSFCTPWKGLSNKKIKFSAPCLLGIEKPEKLIFRECPVSRSVSDIRYITMVDCETNSTTVFAMVFYLYVASFGHPGCPSQKFYTQKYAKVNLLPICWKLVFGFFGPRPPSSVRFYDIILYALERAIE